MKKENINISCDVCLDLIPLVKDKVASDDSNYLVFEHIKTCEKCKAELDITNINNENTINDKKIINSMKKSLLLTGFAFIICGALIGVYLSNSMAMFYNFLIMPIIGGCSYLVLNKKWYLTSIGIFILSFIWLFIQNVYEGAFTNGFNIEVFSMPMFFSTIYAGLTILGVIIILLLKFAFRKEVQKWKKN